MFQGLEEERALCCRLENRQKGSAVAPRRNRFSAGNRRMPVEPRLQVGDEGFFVGKGDGSGGAKSGAGTAVMRAVTTMVYADRAARLVVDEYSDLAEPEAVLAALAAFGENFRPPAQLYCRPPLRRHRGFPPSGIRLAGRYPLYHRPPQIQGAKLEFSYFS